MSKRILITGAGGFIGSHLARRLYNDGHFVRAVDIKWNTFFKKPFYTERKNMDLRNYKNCIKLCKGTDYVYHFAADRGDIGCENAIGADILSNNILMNLNILKSAIECNVERIFMPSAASVYPEVKGKKWKTFKEEDAIPANPCRFYGWEKLFTEKLCRGFIKDYSLDVRIARYYNIYGPFCELDSGREKVPLVICKNIAMSMSDGKVIIDGNKKERDSFCYINDCIEATLNLMESDYKEPINIGSDKIVSLNNIVNSVIKASGKNIKKEYKEKKSSGLKGKCLNLNRAKKVLDWTPDVDLDEGIRRTYPWVFDQILNREIDLQWLK